MGTSNPARFRLRLPITAWLGVALSAVSRAEAANPFLDIAPRNMELLLVLLAGVGVLLVAAGVLAFAIRELRRDAAERRRIYTYRRRGPDGGRSSRPARSD